MLLLYSDAGFHDRVVIQELLKQVAQVQSLETSHREFKGDSKNFLVKAKLFRLPIYWVVFARKKFQELEKPKLNITNISYIEFSTYVN